MVGFGSSLIVPLNTSLLEQPLPSTLALQVSGGGGGGGGGGGDDDDHTFYL